MIHEPEKAMLARPLNFLLALFACGALALPVIGSAGAATGAPWKFAVDTPAAFEAQAAEVRKEMGADGQYGGITLSDRNAVEADLGTIDALLRKRGSATKLNDAEQVELMNAQEHINAVLTSNDGNRLICTMESRTGTKFKMKVCQTAKERERIRARGREGFENLTGQQRLPCVRVETGGCGHL